MTEEYDVFGDLDALCSDKLENFKNTIPAAAPTQDNISDDDLDLSNYLLDASTTVGNKHTKQDTLLEGPKDVSNYLFDVSTNVGNKHTMQDTLLGGAKDVVGSGSSKTKKKRGKKSLDSLPSPGHSFSSVLAKSAPPAKNPSNVQLASITTQYLPLSTPPPPPPPTIEQATPLRRLTRAMRRAESSTEEQPTTNKSPVVFQTLQAVVPQEVTQSKSTRGRKSNRGRKRQVQNPIHQMCSRREYAALMAAQSSNVAYVDLVSSPIPRIYGVIDVDSYTEENNENTTDSMVTVESEETNKSIDLSFDEENPEISVKVIWNGNPETFKLRKYQKFSTMFATIAQREDTDVKNLVFNISNKILSPNDTPASIDYKIFQFINGRVLVSKFNSPIINEKKKREANKISLKIQSDQWKRPMQVELLKKEKFKILYIKCGEELNIPYENLKLSFDGELLEFDDTPADLDLEGGEAIDLRVKK